MPNEAHLVLLARFLGVTMDELRQCFSKKKIIRKAVALHDDIEDNPNPDDYLFKDEPFDGGD